MYIIESFNLVRCFHMISRCLCFFIGTENDREQGESRGSRALASVTMGDQAGIARTGVVVS